MYDVLIIGAGIIGTLIARELSRYNLNTLVLEKDNDVGNKTTSANSAIVHSGYDPVPGTLKAKFNVLGNKMYNQLVEELDVPFAPIGSLTVAMYDEQIPVLKDLMTRSKENGVEVELLSKEEVLKLEPHLNLEVKGALYAKTAGIVDPFRLCAYAMENAMDNGVNCVLNEEVIDIKKENDYFIVRTKKSEYKTKVVINACGVYSDKIASMIEDIDWNIAPRKGEYYVLDHFKDDFVKHTIFPLPSSKGKGILVSPTTSGNYIVGPSSEEVYDKDDLSTDSPTLKDIKTQALEMVPNIPFNQVIRVFSGLRATCSRHDFIIEYAKTSNHFINVAGIESPGLVSSPAIAKYVVDELVKPIIELKENKDFNPCVRKHIRMKYLTNEEKNRIIKNNPTYGHMVCNCEEVTLGEILDALNRNCAPHSIKGLKKRTRATFGKCQGGFCQPTVALIMAEHYGVSPLDIVLDNEDSNLVISKIKEGQ